MKNDLNQKQKEATLHKEGPLLIIAGAGTGKTKTVTHRILQLIKDGVPPESILAITFTNKAAKEMRERVKDILSKELSLKFQSPNIAIPLISTFHSLGVYILKENCKLLNIPRHFTILDKQGSLSVIKEALKIVGIDPKQFAPASIQWGISKQKSELVTAEDYADSIGDDYSGKILSSVWLIYERELKKQNSLDFDDLILKTVLLLKNNPKIKDYYRNKWRYLHIDEYQDTNKSQYELSKQLVGEDKNICVVGDGDQNIYSWRGADIKNILNFEKDYDGATSIILEQNYRSTQTILAVANEIIKKNKIRVEKNLFTKNIDGEKISLFEGIDAGKEAMFVANKAREIVRSGVKYEDIAVLYRANFQSRALEEAFLSLQIPYQVLGVKFFDRKEVKDVLAFVRASLNPENLSDIKRIINVPPRGIGKVTLLKMFSGAEASLTPSMQKRVSDFRELLGRIKTEAMNSKTSDLIRFVIKETGMEESFKNQGEAGAEDLENIRELVTLASKYDILSPQDGVEHLLTDAALATDQDSLEKQESAVKLMTVHAAKGLEFPYVFITGLEDGLFPHKKEWGDKKNDDTEEEERRLFYVAVTRAKKKLFLTYASMRMVFGSLQMNAPSEFITEMDEYFLEIEKEDDTESTETHYLDF